MSSATLCEPFRCVSVAKSILRGTENTLSQTRGVSYDFLESERAPVRLNCDILVAHRLGPLLNVSNDRVMNPLYILSDA